MKTRAIQKDDLKSIAVIHKKTYGTEHFTSYFSVPMLAEYYEEILIQNPDSLLAEHEKNIVGFLFAGTKTSNAVNTYVKKNQLRLLWILIKHPLLLLKKIKTKLSKARFVSKAEFRVLSIAVDRNYKALQVGRSLLESLESHLKEKNITRYGLSVRKKNQRAVKFYENHGFETDGTIDNSIYYSKSI